MALAPWHSAPLQLCTLRSYFCHIFLLICPLDHSGDEMSDMDHDDFGGLHRDLLATGAAIDRRGILILGARFSAAFGALQLVGCSDSPTSPTATTTTPTTVTTPTTTTTT